MPDETPHDTRSVFDPQSNNSTTCSQDNPAAAALGAHLQQVAAGGASVASPEAAAWPDPPPGYTLHGELGRGGMGRVLAAHDLTLDREVAIKVLLPGQSAESARLRFVAESRITARLPHPGIPPIHALGSLDDGSPFLAMKLIRGRTLADLLASREPERPEWPRFVQVFEQVCQAVSFAHTRGVIHRDLKPANVMVGDFGEVQVMDWGLAKELRNAELGVRNEDTNRLAATRSPRSGARDADDDPDRTTDHRPIEESTDERTRAGQALGTPAFMPPEQARGELDRIDRRSDVFALGGMLCVILTGSPPYRGRGGLEVIEKASRAELADAFARLDACGADAELVGLCKRCLSADPAARPTDAGEVASQVGAYRAGVEHRLRIAEQQRAAAEAKAAEQRKKRRWQLAVAAAGLVIVAGGLGFAWWDARRAESQARVDGERAAAIQQARDRVPELLTIAAELRREYRFKQAEKTLAQASELAATAGLDDLQPAVRQAQDDLAFVVELDAIRMKRSIWIAADDGIGHFDYVSAPETYRQAFLARGLDVLAAPEQAGARIATSEVRTELLAALDDWAVLMLKEPAMRDSVLAAARRADPDGVANTYRDPVLWENRNRLQGLASGFESERLPPGLLVALADVMEGRRVDAVPMLRHAVSQYPREFLVAFSLAQMLDPPNDTPQEKVGAYRAARALRPDNFAVLNNLGAVLESNGDLRGAIATLKESIRLDSTHASAHNNLGIALKKSGDLPGAIAAYREAIRRRPNTAHQHFNLAKALQANRDLPGAIAACREAIRLDPTFASYHNSLGTTLLASGDLPEAVAACREAIRLNPTFAPYHSNLSIALRMSGDLPGAVAACRKAIQLDPKFAFAHLNLGIALKAGGNLSGAIAALKEAIRLEPNSAVAHNELGIALRMDGDLPAAIAAFKEAIRLEPGASGAFSNLGEALNASGDLPGAIAAFKEAIRLDPHFANAYYRLAGALMADGDLPGAIAAFKEVIRLQPNAADAHYALGTALAQSGDPNGANKAFQNAIRVNPKFALGHYGLGMTLTVKGDFDGAIQAYKEAIRLDPTFAEPHCNLGLLLMRQGKYDEALPYLKRGHELGVARPDWGYPSAKWLADCERKLERSMPLAFPSSWDALPEPPSVVAPPPREVKP